MPSANGVTTNGYPLPLDSVTLMDLLAAGGYRTALMGKAHLQYMTDRTVRPKPFSGVQGVDIVSAAYAGLKLDRAGIIIEADELPENVDVDKFFRVRTFVDGRWRVTLWVDDGFGEMYDRERDPHELCNLWNNSGNKEEKARLVEQMLREQYRYSDLMPRPVYMG